MRGVAAVAAVTINSSKFQKIILTEIERLKGEIEGLKNRAQPVAPDNAIGRLTRMEAINEKSICEANLTNSKIRIEKLELALKRLKNSDYGFCVLCEEPIPERRLELIPESTVCVQCLEKKESD